ncbi:hypothetical protein C5167_012352 [Papaver somniferum]|uniref:MATE efflux family protein n=1 Tax=Papaver somniferum TaxID=3469 RepID=A0A4Y7IX22_PAPSO|nr:hypothetical protein C5167_012352 [Papaver somniferum]
MLGAGHPQAARLAVQVVFVLAATEGIIIGIIMILIRHIWGSAYSNEKEVVDYVAVMMPILAVSNFIDGLQSVLSGTARGCGWQKIGAYVNLGSYYLVGIPCAVLLAFVLHVGGKLISVMFVGHLGELSLSGASMATSFATVTGFSLLTQNIVFPMMISSTMTALLHFVVFWVLVFKAGLGNKGAAIATSISCWINLTFLVLYVKYSGKCERTWTGFSKEVLHDILNFIRLAVPSAIMVCTRVSNELGADHPQAACLEVQVLFVLASTQGILIGTIMILVRHIWGSAYSNEKEVVHYVAVMMPILSISNFVYGLQYVLSGTARGCGWQKIGAYVNLGSYYLVGIPCAVLLAFVLHVGGMEKRASERVYDAAIPVTVVS